MNQHELSRKAPDVASGGAPDPDACPPKGDGESGGGVKRSGAQGAHSAARKRSGHQPNDGAYNSLARLSGFLIRSADAESSRNNALRRAIAPEGCP